MKRKVIIFFFLLALAVISTYLYTYKSHRNIATEKECYTIAAKDLFSAFQVNEIRANAKYLDKTIKVTGNLTTIDIKTKSIVINDKLFATFKNKMPEAFQLNSDIKIKGRFIGYDSLAEELKMDQCVIENP